MPKDYISFLVRLWKTDSQGESAWRVVVEDPHTREVSGFNNLESFFNHLQTLAVDEAVDPNDQDQLAGNQ